MDQPIKKFWHIPLSELLERLNVNPDKGLSQQEANRRLHTYGKNILKVTRSTGSLKLLIAQFNTPLVYMLLFAATLSLILYENTDAFIIFGILIISTVLSFIQERGAVKAMDELLKIVQIKTAIKRDGCINEIPVEEVVPGDIVELNAGDVIPGDCYLLESKDLFVDEAALTGETYYSEKKIGIVSEEAPITQRSNVLFMGTHVVSGTGRAVVVSTGKETEFGQISRRLEITPPETDFEHGVKKFGYFLMEVTFILVIVIFAFNIYLQRPVVESLLFALALAVGLTPQLLPAIIAINLAHGAKKMAQNRVIVKKLASIENFGSMNILCSDKTGTLTTGEIELKSACDESGKESEKVLLYASLNAAFQTGYTNPIDRAITKKHIDISGWEKIDEIPYDFIRKRISILVQKGERHLMITKGAFQKILEISTFRPELVERFETLSQQGYRVLGIAAKELPQNAALENEQESGMTFIGFLLFWDPIKPDILATVAELKELGIQLKIITGDNAIVAQNIGKIVGLSEKEVLTGSELREISDRALPHQVLKKTIFAEIEPNQKERIILALRKGGNVVGYLGDGINDVTALHAADVSISVDSAVDAAKEVANIVLMEKNLSVLQEGVKAGRMTFANTLKYVFMASSANFGNMFSMAGASLFLPFLPLLPKQVLLNNLMTDFPEMTIATDRVDQEMIQKPLRWNIAFIRRFMFVFGLISSVFDYATFGVLLWLDASVDEFRTGWFVESVFSATLIVLVIRTFRPFFTSWPSPYLLSTVGLVVFSTGLLPFLPFAESLGFTPLSKQLYLCIVFIVMGYVATVEIAKKIFFKHAKKTI